MTPENVILEKPDPKGHILYDSIRMKNLELVNPQRQKVS